MLTVKARRIVALAAVVAGLAAVTVTFVTARDGGSFPGEDLGKLDPTTITPTVEPTVPSGLIGLDEARRTHLSGPAVASLDGALRTGRAPDVMANWARLATTCFVGSGRTGSLCEGLSGPDGTEHKVETLRYSSWRVAIKDGQALLDGLLAGNRAELVLVARAVETGHLLVAYKLTEPRKGVAGDPEASTAYLLLELDTGMAAPIVSLSALESSRSPIDALRQHEMNGSLGTVIAATDELVAEGRTR